MPVLISTKNNINKGMTQMDITDYFIDKYQNTKKEHLNLINLCNDIIFNLAEDISCAEISNLPYKIEDYAKMHLIAECMYKIFYLLLFFEDLSHLSVNKSAAVSSINKILNKYYNILISELDWILDHCATYKYNDSRCIEIIHKLSDICNFYKKFFNKMAPALS